MRNETTKRGPKRKRPIDADRMVTTTIRLPAVLLLQLDAEAARLARETGIASLNRSDVARALLSEALAARATRATAPTAAQ